MSTKHTPGPWERFRESEQCADAQFWAEHKHHIVGSFRIVFSAGWEAAYAQPLHKAAPDLLEACERLLGWSFWESGNAEHDAEFARAAIAKAKGEA